MVIYLITALNQGSTERVGYSKLKVRSQVVVQVHYLAAVPETRVILDQSLVHKGVNAILRVIQARS